MFFFAAHRRGFRSNFGLYLLLQPEGRVNIVSSNLLFKQFSYGYGNITKAAGLTSPADNST